MEREKLTEKIVQNAMVMVKIRVLVVPVTANIRVMIVTVKVKNDVLSVAEVGANHVLIVMTVRLLQKNSIMKSTII